MSENQQLEKVETEADGELERETQPRDERLAPGELSRTSFNCFGGFGGFGINFRIGLRLQRSVSYDDRRRQNRESSPPSPPYTPTTVADSKLDVNTDAVSCRCKECVRLEKRVSDAKTTQVPSLANRQRRRRSASVGDDDAEKRFPLNGNSRSLDSASFPPPASPSSDIQEWWKKRRKMIRKRRNKVKSSLVKAKKNKTTQDTDFVADGILTDRYPDESDSLWWSIREDVRLPN